MCSGSDAGSHLRREDCGYHSTVGLRVIQKKKDAPPPAPCGCLSAKVQRELVIDNLLVRIHFFNVMIRWTGLAPWEFDFPFPGSLTSTFLGIACARTPARPLRMSLCQSAATVDKKKNESAYMTCLSPGGWPDLGSVLASMPCV